MTDGMLYSDSVHIFKAPAVYFAILPVLSYITQKVHESETVR